MAKPADVTLTEIHDFAITQIAGWPETMQAVLAASARQAGCGAAPGPGQSASGEHGSLLRVEPLKLWLIRHAPPEGPILKDGDGAELDLSASRVWLTLRGPRAATLLNHFLPLNLSDAAFPDGAVALSGFHHVGVTLWRNKDGFNLFLPSSFAVSLREQLEASAAQYGLETART